MSAANKAAHKARIVGAAFGKLDVVATAEGKLIPQTYLKIIQPFEQGLVREILVSEGEHVQAGQVLMRLEENDISAEQLPQPRNERKP